MSLQQQMKTYGLTGVGARDNCVSKNPREENHHLVHG